MAYTSETWTPWKMTEKRPVKLLNRLDELDIARKAVAEAAGVTERTVYRWLSYQMEPKLTFVQVAKLCSLLDWTAQELADSYYPSDRENPISTELPGDYAPN